MTAKRTTAREWVKRGAISAVLIPLASLALADTARLSVSTEAYDHDVLGGLPPYSTLDVTLEGQSARLVLDPPLVFEDAEARLWDVMGDPRPEIVVVESHFDKGARLTVFALEGATLKRQATTRFIGQTHRWLAPAAAADFDGDGRVEMAYVDRPHLLRELVFVVVKGNRLVETARIAGLTNHRIGDATITSALRDCGDGPEVLLASADWSRLIAATPKGTRDLGPFSGAAFKQAQTCP